MYPKVKPLDELKLRNLVKQQAGSRFVDMFVVVNLPHAHHILVFVKTTVDFEWGEEFIGEDLAENYLSEELHYREVIITASTSMKGGLCFEN